VPTLPRHRRICTAKSHSQILPSPTAKEPAQPAVPIHGVHSAHAQFTKHGRTDLIALNCLHSLIVVIALKYTGSVTFLTIYSSKHFTNDERDILAYMHNLFDVILKMMREA